MKREDLIEEASNVSRDLTAFRECRDVLGRRMGEMESEDPKRLEDFEQWACTQVVMNGFVLAITRCEGLLEDYQNMLNQMEPAPVLSLVKGEEP
jgi:hypothetical protein